ncbi:hypothetical protein [Coleofasciculus sp. FACHB-SPT36]|uniref:hypothetical protein n=1 Tax=Cyanophyceae TaxID=3028117 RepID=UPI00168AB0EF|nr:hypothetical protein [Coleofasciculus sp. FACHB-SPT36]MBD2537592.1 hypothetical protein [Coleofasciculus sp. FACHB-SPT36]
MMSNIKRVKVAIAFSATLLFTAAIPTAALAGDNKVYAGSMCQPETSASNQQFSRAAGQFSVQGTTSINLHCPVVRDITSGTENGSAGPLAFVHVFSRNAQSTTLQCELRANQPNSLSFQFQKLTIALSGGATGTPKKHVFNFTGPVAQTANGAYEVVCSLPPGTGVASYSIAE